MITVDWGDASNLANRALHLVLKAEHSEISADFSLFRSWSLPCREFLPHTRSSRRH
jgi:hypothetical protein